MKFDFEIGGGFVECSMGSGGDDPNVIVRRFLRKVENSTYISGSVTPRSAYAF
jgi:hypothetical protein